MENDSQHQDASEESQPEEEVKASEENPEAPGAKTGWRPKLHHIFFFVVGTAAILGAVLPILVDGMQTKIQHWIAYALLPFMIWMVFASRKRDEAGD